MISSLTPGLIFILGGLISFGLRGLFQKLFILSLPIFAFYQMSILQSAEPISIDFLFSKLSLMRIDNLSYPFALVIILSALAAFIYGFNLVKQSEYASACIYIGSALGVIFAGDLITLYIFWELMAVSSSFLVILSGGDRSRKSAIRYLLVHLVGGLILLAGMILHIHETGSTEFISFKIQNTATWLMLIGILVNAAAVPLSSWLSDAYPESTLMGGVILSAVTTKTAIYTLLRAYTGWEELIWIGVIMALFGVIYAFMENDIRRILSFSIINQGGFMVCAVGIGTPLAIAGGTAHAFCCIIYTAILWMSAGAVMHRTGKSKCTELGGLYYSMPITFAVAIVGALAIAAAPFASGFTSKTMILKALKYNELFIPWVLLELASVGVVLHAGLKYIYFVFLGKDKGIRASDPPITMIVPMILLSGLTLFIGCFPKAFYEILPYSQYVFKKVPYTFQSIYFANFENVITQFQLLSLSVLAFFVFFKYIKVSNTISIDFDWLYRRLLRFIYIFLIAFIDFIYNFINNVCMSFIHRLASFFRQSVPFLLYLVNVPYLRISNIKINKFQLMNDYSKNIEKQAYPFSIIGSFVFILFIIIFVVVS
tara:strand:- start:4086 stop:5879 length:1794 start_codon:yes stop_codon:yes gene_type:complete